LNKRFLLLFAFLLMQIAAWSQDLGRHNWYFGNSTNAIRFNRGTNLPSVVTNKAIPFGDGGSAVATDAGNGNILFYTDGQRVYDAVHQPMPGTGGLTGVVTANQPAAVSPIPGNRNRYFIFTNSADFSTATAGTISRLVIDMSLFGNATFPTPPRGEGTGTVAAIPGLPANRSEGMIIVPHNNNNDFWLISHEMGSQNYSATLIDAASLGGAFATTTSPNLGILPIAVAHFAYHPGLKKLAVAPQGINQDAVILDFDDTNGVITFDRTIFNSGIANSTNSQSIYDIEWSPSGRYLYLSRFGDTGITPNVFQYDYQVPATTLTPILPLTTIFRSYGLQLAPDKAIYHLYQASAASPIVAGRISSPDSAVSANVRYVPTPLGNVNFIGKQFPAFLPYDTLRLNVNFSFIGTCQNSPTTFFPEVKPGADSVRWYLGDGSTNSWSPVHTYQNAQTYNVKLVAFYRGHKDSVTLPVTIRNFALQLQLVQDTTACRSEFPPPRGSSSPTQFSVKAQVSGGTPTSYSWSNGDIGDTLTPDSAGYYYVVVTDASGCSAYAGVNVKEYGLENQTFNKWYFGNKAGIDFNLTPPKALNESAMNAPAGCAIVCDQNGQQLFYTDGDKVYNKNHQEIATGIGGNPVSSQSSIIIPVPGDETLYYIFTTEAIDGLSPNQVYYSLFDLKKNNGLGEVVKQRVPLFSRSTERLTASGQWLIVHEYGNNTFRTYPISQAGIGKPVYSSIGSDHNFAPAQNGQGYMKLGPRDNLAVALSTPGIRNVLEVFHLNDTTGRLTNYRKADLNEPNGQIYGIEFSQGGNKVFATVKGPPSKLFEYSIDSLERVRFKQQIQGAGEFGALQRGPDGQIYMAINGSTQLGTIAATDDTLRLSSFTAAGFALAAGTRSNLGLPNFIQINSDPLGGPSISVAGICTNDSTTISGSPRDQIDEYNWQIRQGNNVMKTSQAASFRFLFPAPGVYTVSLRLHNRCAADTTLIRNVTIYDAPAAPGGASPICTGAVTLDANPAGVPNLTYRWSTTETTRTISVAQQGTNTVAVTNANGCTTNGTFLVVDNRPQLQLGPDLTLCQNTPVRTLDALNPGANYQWTINNAPANTTQFQTVATNVAGTFAYAVRVTDPITTCFIEDTQTFTIGSLPAISFGNIINPTACTGAGSAIGAFDATITSPGPFSYQLRGPAGFSLGAPNQMGPMLPIPLTNLVAGTYTLVVTDQRSGCTTGDAIGLNLLVNPFDYTATSDCNNIDITLNSGTPAPNMTYIYTNRVTGNQRINSNIPNINNNTAPGLPAGDYIIQATDANSCIYTFPHTKLPVIEQVSINTSNLCMLSQLSADVTGGTAASYLWNGPNLPPPPGGQPGQAIIVNASGRYTVTVTLSGGAGCKISEFYDIVYDNAVVPAITQTDACANTVTLTVTPNGRYTYRWFKKINNVDVYQPNLGGTRITLGMSENLSVYRVELINRANGCIYSTPDHTVRVEGPVSAAITSTPACDDGKPFTLTATTIATGATFTWYLNNQVITGVNTPVINQTTNGTYRVEIAKNTCRASAQISMIKQPVPTGRLVDRALICSDRDNQDENTNHVDLDPGSFLAYEWFKNELSLNYTQRVYTATSEGKYVVEMTNTFGCKGKDKIDIINQCIPKIVAPNAFRPGSSVTNNKDFHVLSYFITDDFEVFIFNRWGELVYQSNDRHFKWNGGYNGSGQPLPGGTYAYIIRYVSVFQPQLGKQEQRGGVALLR
jgi:large repetitive protein